jgi:hypothetical protein
MTNRVHELIAQAGLPVDEKSLALVRLIVGQCQSICTEIGEDVDNGNIFFQEKALSEAFKTRLGTGPYLCAEKIGDFFIQTDHTGWLVWPPHQEKP